MQDTPARKPAETTAADPVPDLIKRARAAMATFAAEIAREGQPRIDEAVTALAWSIYKPETAKRYAELAVEVTGIGNVPSKIIKNQRKTFGTLRDLLRAKSTGIIEEQYGVFTLTCRTFEACPTETRPI